MRVAYVEIGELYGGQCGKLSRHALGRRRVLDAERVLREIDRLEEILATKRAVARFSGSAGWRLKCFCDVFVRAHARGGETDAAAGAGRL